MTPVTTETTPPTELETELAIALKEAERALVFGVAGFGGAEITHMELVDKALRPPWKKYVHKVWAAYPDDEAKRCDLLGVPENLR